MLKEIPSNTKLPISIKQKDILPLYRISTVTSSIQSKRIIYEIKFPLPFTDNYQLYKILPFPTKVQDKFLYIQPKINFIIVDFDRKYFYDLSILELNKCTTQIDSLLCPITHPLYDFNSNQDHCEIQLLRRETQPSSCKIKESHLSIVWIQLSQPGKWLLSVKDEYVMDEVCDRQITTHKFKGTGLIDFTGKCYLRSKELTIFGQNSENTILKNSFIPPINISLLNSSLPPNLSNKKQIQLFKYEDDNSLTELSQQIDYLKREENKKLQPLNKHDIHHYTLIYTLAAALFIVLVYILKYKFNPKPIVSETKSETAKENDKTQTDIDIQLHDKNSKKSSPKETIVETQFYSEPETSPKFVLRPYPK